MLKGLAAAPLWGCAHGGAREGAPVFDVTRFGARGDGQTDDTSAVAQALAACGRAGGGTVWVPAGTYRVGPLRLESRTTLYLDAGATLQGSTQVADYPERIDPYRGESSRAGLLTAFGAETIAILGRGTLDGASLSFTTDDLSHKGSDHLPELTRQGSAFLSDVPFSDGPYRKGENRPGNVLRLHDCRNVRIEGITIQNSSTWNVRLSKCRDVVLRGLDVNSRAAGLKIPNDDGIDLQECESVRISDCHIETGDDCVALFGSSGVTMTNCWLRTRSTAVRVGYDGPAATRGCTFSNLVIDDANRGLGVFVRGAGDVEDVSFSDCVVHTRLMTGRWWGKGEPIHVSVVPWDEEATGLGRVRGVRFQGIQARSPAGIVAWGDPQSEIESLSFRDIEMHVRRDPLAASYGGNFDLRLAKDPRLNLFAHEIPGLFARHVSRLSVDRFDLSWDDDVIDFYGPALVAERFGRVSVARLSGRAAHPARDAALCFRDGHEVSVVDSRVQVAHGGFIEVTEVKTPLQLDRNQEVPFSPAS